MIIEPSEDNPSPSPLRLFLRLALAVLAVTVGLLVFADWRDPCRGQITDLWGCVVASLEAEEADQAEKADQAEADARQAFWCEEIRTRFVSGRYILAKFEAAYEQNCVPGTDMLTLDDVEGLP